MINASFNATGELITINSVTDKQELEIIESISTATKKRWENKRLVDGKTVCMFKNMQLLPGGLWLRLAELKTKYNIDVNLTNNFFDNSITKDSIYDFVASLNFHIGGKHATLAEHQLIAVYNAIKFKRACISIGTSGGKTFIAASIAAYLLSKHNYSADKKFLIIVPSQLLCSQGLADFESFQQNLDSKLLKTYTVYSGAKNKYKLAESNVVFSTYQSLVNMPEEYFEQFNYVFVDEGHRAIESTLQCVKNLAQCKYRFAFSGSFPQRHTYEMLMLESYIGPYLYEFKAAKLRDAGFTSDFTIVKLKIVHSAETTKQYYDAIEYNVSIRNEYAKLIELLNNQTKIPENKRLQHNQIDAVKQRLIELRALNAHTDFNRRLFEEEYLFNNTARLKAIANFVNSLDKNCLVLARRKNEVRGLYEHLANVSTKNVHLIMGGVDNKDEIIKTIKNGAIDEHHLVGNVDMIGTGVSINELFYAVYSGIGKSPYTAIQTTGRLIRKHNSKNMAIIFDCYDELLCDNKKVPRHMRTSYSSQHSAERFKLYADENYKVHTTDAIINI